MIKVKNISRISAYSDSGPTASINIVLPFYAGRIEMGHIAWPARDRIWWNARAGKDLLPDIIWHISMGMVE